MNVKGKAVSSPLPPKSKFGYSILLETLAVIIYKGLRWSEVLVLQGTRLKRYFTIKPLEEATLFSRSRKPIVSDGLQPLTKNIHGCTVE